MSNIGRRGLLGSRLVWAWSGTTTSHGLVFIGCLGCVLRFFSSKSSSFGGLCTSLGFSVWCLWGVSRLGSSSDRSCCQVISSSFVCFPWQTDSALETGKFLIKKEVFVRDLCFFMGFNTHIIDNIHSKYIKLHFIYLLDVWLSLLATAILVMLNMCLEWLCAASSVKITVIFCPSSDRRSSVIIRVLICNNFVEINYRSRFSAGFDILGRVVAGLVTFSGVGVLDIDVTTSSWSSASGLILLNIWYYG